jgi:hypothetical protein
MDFDTIAVDAKNGFHHPANSNVPNIIAPQPVASHVLAGFVARSNILTETWAHAAHALLHFSGGLPIPSAIEAATNRKQEPFK